MGRQDAPQFPALPQSKIRRPGCSLLAPGSARQCTAGSLAHLDPTPGTLKSYNPKLPRGAAHLDVGSAPRFHSPAPQSFMVTPDTRSPTLPGPPRTARLLSPLRRGGAIQLRSAPRAPSGLLPGAGGASRGSSRSGRVGAGGGHSAPRGIVSKIRPLWASRKQLIRPRPHRVKPTAGQW